MNIRGKKGITLISLVVTIIVLLILASVTINLSLGDNGLFNKAKKAKEEYELATINEQTQLNELYAYLKGEDELPENTKDTQAGTIVKLPSKWQTSTPRYVSTENGVEVISSSKVANVYAVAVGNAQTVPVPVGFWYVGGNLTTGVIISDNKDDRYGYNPDTKEENDTTLDKTTHEYTTKLKENQFVWIPCTEEEYKKCDTWEGTTQTNTTLGNTWWDTTIDSAEKMQIKKYGGFYVARYEAGLATTIKEYEEAQSNTSTIYNTFGIPQSKAGVIPWIFIDWTTSQKNAESMYNTDYVNSGLITGTQWDVIINKIANVEGKSLTDSESWGNYINSSFSYTGRYASYNTSTKQLSVFSELQSDEKNSTTRALLTTGASEKTKAYNLYDIAGNVNEWTEEISFYGEKTSTQYKVLRGGSYYNASTGDPACKRSGNRTIDFTSDGAGFRVVLYIR